MMEIYELPLRAGIYVAETFFPARRKAHPSSRIDVFVVEGVKLDSPALRGFSFALKSRNPG
jgi:hypothetical protein